MNSKKGVSAIVATVMIILITIAVAGILFVAVVPMVREQLETGTLCFDAVSQLQISNKGYTCIGPSGNTVSLQINRGSKEFDLADVQVLVSAQGTTMSYDLLDAVSGASVPGPNEERTYEIDTTGMGADRANIEEVQIAPIVRTGNTQKTCDVSAKAVLKSC